MVYWQKDAEGFLTLDNSIRVGKTLAEVCEQDENVETFFAVLDPTDNRFQGLVIKLKDHPGYFSTRFDLSYGKCWFYKMGKDGIEPVKVIAYPIQSLENWIPVEECNPQYVLEYCEDHCVGATCAPEFEVYSYFCKSQDEIRRLYSGSSDHIWWPTVFDFATGKNRKLLNVI